MVVLQQDPQSHAYDPRRGDGLCKFMGRCYQGEDARPHQNWIRRVAERADDVNSETETARQSIVNVLAVLDRMTEADGYKYDIPMLDERAKLQEWAEGLGHG